MIKIKEVTKSEELKDISESNQNYTIKQMWSKVKNWGRFIIFISYDVIYVNLVKYCGIMYVK